jgi:hypothetical protein
MPDHPAPDPGPTTAGHPFLEWTAALGTGALAFLVMWAYHDLGRGKPYSLATANEAAALAAVVALAVALARRSIARIRGRLAERRGGPGMERALLATAGLFALVHVGLTLGVLRERFDRAYLSDHPALLGLGLLATGLLAWLLLAGWPSRDSPALRGQWADRSGQALLLVVLLHFMVLGKVERWLDWARTLDHPVPPGTLPVFVIGLVPLGLGAFAAGLDRRRR